MENIYVLFSILVLSITIVLYFFTKFNGSKQDHEKFKDVLLRLVIEAEDFYGSKKGKEKFEFAYTNLVAFFPWVRLVPMSIVHKLVDKALDKMRESLEK